MSERFKIRKNFIDKAIEFIDPVRAANRYKSRIAIEFADSSYNAASKVRRALQEWKTSSTDADSENLFEKEVIRSRSADLIRNNPIAAGAANVKLANIIGPGLKMNSRIDGEFLKLSPDQVSKFQRDAEREFSLWGDSVDCDAARQLTFDELQGLAFISAFERGDVFGLMTEPKNRVHPQTPYKLAVQLIEADLCSNPLGGPDTATLVDGVVKNDAGEATDYWFSNQHEGTMRLLGPRKWTKYERFGVKSGRIQVLHVFKQKRVGQSRGVPELAPVVEALKSLGTYTDSELQAAVVASFFTVFIKTLTGGANGQPSLGLMKPTEEIGGTESDKDFKMGPGAMLDLLPEEDVVFANPQRPNSGFDPFVLAIMRQIGMALGLPYELLIGHFTASYSASRAALIQAWKFFMRDRTWFVKKFCQLVYAAWMDEAVAAGRLQAPGYFSDPAIRYAYQKASWTGPVMGQLNPKQEAEALAIFEEHCWKTGSEIVSETTGGDYEQNLRQRGNELKLKQEYLGAYQQPAAAGPGKPAGDQPAKPGEEKTPDKQDREEEEPEDE